MSEELIDDRETPETDESETLSRDGLPYTSPLRLNLARSLRRLGNSLVSHQPDDDELARVLAAIDELIPLVERSRDRGHAFHLGGEGLFSTPIPDGASAERSDAFPDCIVSGRANPMGLDARLWRDGDEAVLNVVLGPAFEGAPGRTHGGVVASLIDETMGLVLAISSTPAFTGRLSITYRSPTPLGEFLEARARLIGRSGRKVTVGAELRCGDTLLAEAEGLFIAVDIENFVGLSGRDDV
ncbi:MAG: PaaI family thioesterase [Actinobacteria bacterium]|nr:PaaI family thioesterase [Actinomycetota bacterium]